DEIKAVGILRRNQAIKGLHHKAADSAQLLTEASSHIRIKAGDITPSIDHAPGGRAALGIDFRGRGGPQGCGDQRSCATNNNLINEFHGVLSPSGSRSIDTKQLHERIHTAKKSL